MDIIGVQIAGINQISLLNEFLPFLPLLSSEKCDRLSRFHRKEDFLRSLISELLIRVITVNQLNLSNGEIQFATNAFGKPSLIGCGIEFNLSHSGEWVICAVDQTPVGIDIEMIQTVDLDLARRFFSEKEYAELAAKEEEERQHYFFDLWTLKESYIKACGGGLSIPLDLISFTIRGKDITCENKHSPETYYFRQYHVDDRYKLSVCSQHDTFPKQVKIWSLDQLLRDAVQLLKEMSIPRESMDIRTKG